MSDLPSFDAHPWREEYGNSKNIENHKICFCGIKMTTSNAGEKRAESISYLLLAAKFSGWAL